MKIKNLNGKTSSMYGERRGAYRILVGRPEERDDLEDPDIDGRIILKWIFKKQNGGMDWVDLVQGRDRWQAVVNVVISRWVT
jgi:hypothetical protein